MRNSNFNEITWGDEVAVDASAPVKYRPSNVGSVCGIYKLDTEDKAKKYGGKLGTVMYLVEFSDSTAIEIPHTFLVKVSRP